MKFNSRHIIASLLLAIFLVKGMAGILSIFSTNMSGAVLIELVHSSETEENKNIPETKTEGEPNEYFITYSFGTPDLSLVIGPDKQFIYGSSPEQPGYGSVPTPPPDQA